jgi:DNA recombination protein RmuC
MSPQTRQRKCGGICGKTAGDGDKPVWLPVDSKFPGETYAALIDAYDSGNTERVSAATRELDNRILQCAKDIRDKYIEPPYTTDFAILFLPFEGLYAEVVRRGMVERLQELHINIAGPTTMAALLNALQMGFRTLAIQKRTDEIWQVLGAVKTEFSSFSDVLKRARDRLSKTGEDIDFWWAGEPAPLNAN